MAMDKANTSGLMENDSHDKRSGQLCPYAWLKQTILRSIFLVMFSLLLGLVSAVVSKHYTNGRVIFNKIINTNMNTTQI